MSYFAKASQSWFLLLAAKKLYKVQCYKQSVLSRLVVDYDQGRGEGERVRVGDKP